MAKKKVLVLFLIFSFVLMPIAVFAKPYYSDSQLLASSSKASVSGGSESYDCSNPRLKQVMGIMGTILDWIQIVIPAILVVSGCVALGKAVLSGDDSAVKGATKAILTKIFISATIIFLPLIIFSIVKLIPDYGKGKEASFKTCIECLKDPDSCAK